MFKRILKVFGICMAILVVVIGAAVGIYALSGGFKTTIIDITKLYIDDVTRAEKEIYTLNDITTMINCEPFDATDKKLEVIVADPLRVNDGDGNLVKEGVLKNVPKTVMAGEEFKLEINKDSMGNNIGGVVSLTFRPADQDKIITDFTLKIVVDVAIPNNSLYFAGNDSDVFTTNGKNITMGLSNTEQNVYLKSNLVNAFCLETSSGNLKQAHISIDYKNQKGEQVEGYPKTFSDLQYKPNYNASTKEYNYYYEVPVIPKTPGTIEVTAKMHRTNEIEKAYNTGYNGKSFDQMPLPSVNSNEAQMALDAYNAFINKYIEFFDKSDESYSFFKDYLTDDGKVKLPYAQVEESKKFIFQTCTSTITVTAVNLSGITSIETPKEYNVLSSKTFTLNQLINEYSLNVTLDHEDNVANISTEKYNLFSTLNVRPYVYVQKEDYLNYKDTLWADYKNIFGVLEFDDGKPTGVEPLTSQDVDGYTGIGFMLLLERNDTSYQDYIDISTSSDIDNKTWTLDFNVPLKNDSVANISDVKKALFLEFEVTGRDLKNNTKIVKNTYSRVFIEYTEYSFYDDENAKIGFPNEIKRMAINHNVQNAIEYGYADKLNQQNIDISLQSTVSNYNQIQYKSVMYFVEEQSNQIEGGGPKIASIGKYNFKYMNASTGGTDDMVKLYGGAENLIGERLLNSGTKDNPNYYIHAINASETPANIFAVVYLSDKDGNPIDINGRKIKIDEQINGDPTTLVVFAITDVTENGIQKVYIDSFVENINFYTGTKQDFTITDTIINEDNEEISGVYNATGFVKRNNLDSYTDVNTGVTFSDEKLSEIQNLLVLKLLYRNEFTLYATNFEWDESGSVNGEEGFDEDKSVTIKMKDFNGKEVIQEFVVNTLKNKQLALNTMCENYDNEYTLNISTGNSNPISSTEILRDEEGNATGIKYTLVVEDKIGTSNDYIYIRAQEGIVNALGNSTDFVNWKVTKVTATDAELVNVETSVKLYSRYTSNYNTTNYQEFGRVTKSTSDNSLSYQKYYLYESSAGVTEGSMEDNLQFVVSNNLGTYADNIDPNSEFTLNLDVIDMSQAVYQSTDEAPENASQDYFASISDYMDRYLNDANNVEITYLNPAGLYKLKQDLIFTSEGDNKIHIGEKEYEITNFGLNDAFITVNNQEYKVGSTSKVIIPANSFVPIVKGYSDEGQDIVVILGQEFTVKTKNIDGRTAYIINNIPESSGYQQSFEVVKIDTSNYNPHEYINDGTKNPSAKDTALIKEKDVDKVKRATVDFLKGGLELDSITGLPIFVKDDNGNYRLKDGGDITNPLDYEPCSTGYQGYRYSKKGIRVFLMVTIQNATDNGAFAKPITKAIEYELIQEPIELKARDIDGNICKIIDSSEIDVTNPKFNLYAGGTVNIELANNGNIPVSVGGNYTPGLYVIGASFETGFYQHCTFELDGDASGIRFKKSNNVYSKVINAGEIENISNLTIDVPSSYRGQTALLKIKYLYQDRLIEKKLEFNIIPDFEFKLKPGADVSVRDDGAYEITLDVGSTFDGDSLSNYFIGKPGTKLVAGLISNGYQEKLYSINGNSITIGNSYAIVQDGTSVATRDVIECPLFVQTDDGSKIIPVDNILRIIINPVYTFDFSGINSSPTILNGECLLANRDYIKIYSGYSMDEKDLVNIANYESILKGLFTIVDEDGNDYSEKVTQSDIYNTLNKKLFLQYKIGPESANNIISHEFDVNIRGYEVFFSKLGNISMLEDESNSEYYDRVKNAFTTITSATMYLSENETRDISDYFAVFTKDNGGDYSLDIELKKPDGSYTRNLNRNDANKTYTLTVSINNSGNYVRVYDSNIAVNIVLVEAFCDSNGNMQNHVDYPSLKNNGYDLVNVEYVGNIDDEILIQNYYQYFYVDNGFNHVNVVLVDSNSNTKSVNDTIVVTSDNQVFKVCYVIDGVTYDTGFTFTVKSMDV